jgi:glutamate-1-semialdehyde aminotransferase
MLDRGIIYLSPTVSHCWISSPHTKEDIDAYLVATEDFVKTFTK